ncbi:hypothetical protein ACRALDRAFT_2017888 [Sodiomyces alcalophilus JCM 7366]|uniref:uncharacterized protein n=1 Tax=Sodiomyces alcalophilus JCM 7366 TaxID=591952 RepID=UPI0039B5D24B
MGSIVLIPIRNSYRHVLIQGQWYTFLAGGCIAVLSRDDEYLRIRYVHRHVDATKSRGKDSRYQFSWQSYEFHMYGQHPSSDNELSQRKMRDWKPASTPTTLPADTDILGNCTTINPFHPCNDSHPWRHLPTPCPVYIVSIRSRASYPVLLVPNYESRLHSNQYVGRILGPGPYLLRMFDRVQWRSKSVLTCRGTLPPDSAPKSIRRFKLESGRSSLAQGVFRLDRRLYTTMNDSSRLQSSGNLYAHAKPTSNDSQESHLTWALNESRGQDTFLIPAGLVPIVACQPALNTCRSISAISVRVCLSFPTEPSVQKTIANVLTYMRKKEKYDKRKKKERKKRQEKKKVSKKNSVSAFRCAEGCRLCNDQPSLFLYFRTKRKSLSI